MPVFLKISLLLLAVYTAISAIALLSFQLSPKNVAVFIITPLLAYDGIVSYITLIEVPNKRSATDMAVNLAELVLLIILWIVAPPSFVIGVIVITVKDVVKALIFTFWWRKRIFVPSESIRIWIPRLVKFGFFPMLSLLMTTLNYRVDVLMLNGRVTDAAIGVYSVGVLLAERIWMIPDAMKGVMVSHIAKGKDANETANVIRICNTVCLVIILGIVALGKPFIDIAFGAEYNGAYQVTLILLAGVFSMIYYKLIASYNIAMGKQIVSFVLLSVGVVCNVIANLILIPMLGIYGAGIASVISYAICSMLFIVYFCRTTKIPFRRMLFIDRADYVRVKKWLKRK
jgi:O-antigen/teichoic acid export membrane protein